jgi:GntR family transcriptional regulator
MIKIDPSSPVAINEQIKAALKGLVARGLLRPGDRAPSTRSLALELKVNPNTVARALHELVDEDILEARRGDGCFVAQQAGRKAGRILQDAANDLGNAVRRARQAGLSWEEIEGEVKRCKNGEKL